MKWANRYNFKDHSYPAIKAAVTRSNPSSCNCFSNVLVVRLNLSDEVRKYKIHDIISSYPSRSVSTLLKSNVKFAFCEYLKQNPYCWICFAFPIISRMISVSWYSLLNNDIWYTTQSGMPSPPFNSKRILTVQSFNKKLKKNYGDAGNWTQDISHAKRALYPWATSPWPPSQE